MANINNPNGMTAVRHDGGGCVRNGGQDISPSNTTPIYFGDPVKLASGVLVKATVTGNVLGTFIGANWTDVEGRPRIEKYWSGESNATGIRAIVVEDPATVYSVQADAALTAADIGKYAPLVLGTPDTALKFSGAKLGTVGTSANQLLVLGLDPSPDNAWGAFQRVLVRVHQHALASVSA